MLCLRKVVVAKKFMDSREGEISRFSFEIFRLAVPKRTVGEPFKVSLISGIAKFYAEEGYPTISCTTYFVSLYRKTLQRNPSVLCFRNFQVAKNFMDKMRKYQDLSSKYFCLSAEKICRGTL